MPHTSRKATLLARQTELTQHMDQIEHDLDAPRPKDWEDNASERQGDEVLEALGTKDQAELRQIEAALARLAAGTYGICTKCGGDISAARLDLLPATPFCKSCA